MAFAEDLQRVLEAAENESVGKSFGGDGDTKNFSISKIRDWVRAQKPFSGTSQVEEALRELSAVLPKKTFAIVIASALRFSFLIELTDLRVGSTKMKTRWLPGKILMPQAGSFEPIRGMFEPGNDPRAATYETCLGVFTTFCVILHEQVKRDDTLVAFINKLNVFRRVAYEFPFGYIDPRLEPLHRADNIAWILNEDIKWLVIARAILKQASRPHNVEFRAIAKRKLEVKVYKTDRALTGKDKTNRAKRWEVLAGDFQHATLENCWSVERKLTTDLVAFEEFPPSIQQAFLENGLVTEISSITRCPVTLAPLNYVAFSNSVLIKAIHGRSDYQVGHLSPLKTGGRHVGSNVCWQSADGNRIQGDLKLGDVERLLDEIAQRRQALGKLGTVTQSE